MACWWSRVGFRAVGRVWDHPRDKRSSLMPLTAPGSAHSQPRGRSTLLVSAQTPQECSECPHAQVEGSPSPSVLGEAHWELQQPQSRSPHWGMEHLLLLWSL